MNFWKAFYIFYMGFGFGTAFFVMFGYQPDIKTIAVFAFLAFGQAAWTQAQIEGKNEKNRA